MLSNHRQIWRFLTGVVPVVLFIGMGFGAFPQRHYAQENRIVKVGIYIDNAPLASVNATTDELVGFEVALMESIAHEADFSIEWMRLETTDTNTVFEMIRRGDIDVAMSTIPIPKTWVAGVEFSNPYFRVRQADDYVFYVMGIRERTLRDLINPALDTLLMNGDYAQLYSVYFGEAMPAHFLTVPIVTLDRADPASVAMYYVDRAFIGDEEMIRPLLCDDLMLPSDETMAILSAFSIDLSEVYVDVRRQGDSATVLFYGTLTLDDGIASVRLDITAIAPQPLYLSRQDGLWQICVLSL